MNVELQKETKRVSHTKKSVLLYCGRLLLEKAYQ
jgi:hypothetical protein